MKLIINPDSVIVLYGEKDNNNVKCVGNKPYPCAIYQFLGLTGG